ncbi:Ger(x)C family spore germination protein [Paenibacillus soyae]|uniref:Ger(X)C family spore germination protein n=1 Tax=Paenibacillus soyae TaxID=2969249 RepID=A0A9X2MS83_9BACL|nr:Ger(x)C family spore germination protein [Paenibacillus soyae]MCR2805229.1 Ger(x)C family spore germination protein [Paenibacillus soyae]
MRRGVFAVLILMAGLMAGCSDRTELDDSTLITITGMDLADNGKLAVTGMVLDFNEESPSQEILLSSTGKTLRENRSLLSSKIGGEFLSGKLQIVIVSKRLLKAERLLPHLDVAYRDPKISNSALIVACDCSVNKLMDTKRSSQPILTEYIRKLIETGHASEITVRSTMQHFHYMETEEGITSSISEIKPVGKELAVVGTMLLGSDGKYAAHLSKEESMLLLLLKKQFTSPASFTTSIQDENHNKANVSLDINKAKVKVKTGYEEGNFVFRIHLPVVAEVVELEGDFRVGADKNQIEALLKEKLEEACRALIAKLQMNRVDPIGYGLHARAFDYGHWKEVRSDWGKAFAEADVKVSVTVAIDSFGVME